MGAGAGVGAVSGDDTGRTPRAAADARGGDSGGGGDSGDSGGGGDSGDCGDGDSVPPAKKAGSRHRATSIRTTPASSAPAPIRKMPPIPAKLE
jgi:hypothetical protein